MFSRGSFLLWNDTRCIAMIWNRSEFYWFIASVKWRWNRFVWFDYFFKKERVGPKVSSGRCLFPIWQGKGDSIHFFSCYFPFHLSEKERIEYKGDIEAAASLKCHRRCRVSLSTESLQKTQLTHWKEMNKWQEMVETDFTIDSSLQTISFG